MSERANTMMAAVAGAVIGAAAGFMFFTERGRALRRELEPVLDELAEELHNFRGTAVKAANVANEGWRLVNETFSGGGAPRFADPHQTTPF
jgi:gas vesicle protein